MNKPIQYAQVMSNFDSAYNIPPAIYMPTSSSFSHRPVSPLFRRSVSPQTRSSFSPQSSPKFNFDLYELGNSDYTSGDYSAPSSFRSTSPTSSSMIIHHHPVQSHRSPPSPSHTLSKLRQINDELCQTLARSDVDQQQSSTPQYHIHHYPLTQRRSRSHSPSNSSTISSTEPESTDRTQKRHNARVTYSIRGPRRRKPPPQQQQHRKPPLSQLDHLLISTSDVYSSDDPMTIDFYPTRDQGFVKQIRNRPDNQRPWLVDGAPIRRSSYSDSTTPRRRSKTPDGPYYGDKPIKPPSRLARGKERSPARSHRQSPFMVSRFRPDSAPSHAPDPYRESAVSFSNSGPLWRPSGSIKRPKFIGSQGPPSMHKPPRSEPRWNPTGTVRKPKHFRAFDPRSETPPSKEPETVWKPTSHSISKKPTRYFEPTPKPEFVTPTGKRIIDGTQSEPVPRAKSTTLSTRPKLRSGNPKLKARIEKAESKVKSAWQPTTNGLTEPKPPIPRPAKKATTTQPPKTTVKSAPSPSRAPPKKIIPTPQQPPPVTTDTGRSSLQDVPKKPLFQSTPMNQSVVESGDDHEPDLFENESQLTEGDNTRLPRPAPRVEKTPTPPRVEKTPPRKPPAELPKTTVPEPNKGTTSTIKDGVLIQGNDQKPSIHPPSTGRTTTPTSEVNDDDKEASHVQPPPPPAKLPTPDRKAPPPKPTNDASVIDDEDVANDEDDEEVARSFRINKWLDDASKAIIGAADNTKGAAGQPPPRPAPRIDAKTPPPRQEQSPAESPDHNLYKPPFGPKKKEPQPPVTPPSASNAKPSTTADDVDDFFN